MTGVEEYDKIRFEIYPNPANESITIKTEQTNELITMQLFDVTGRMIYETSLSGTKTTLDVSAFSAGVYTAVLFDNKAVAARRKIVIQ